MMRHMDQITLGLDPLPKKTRKEIFLEEMNQVVPWEVLVGRIKRWVVVRHFPSRPCCAFTACNCGGT